MSSFHFPIGTSTPPQLVFCSSPGFCINLSPSSSSSSLTFSIEIPPSTNSTVVTNLEIDYRCPQDSKTVSKVIASVRTNPPFSFEEINTPISNESETKAEQSLSNSSSSCNGKDLEKPDNVEKDTKKVTEEVRPKEDCVASSSFTSLSTSSLVSGSTLSSISSTTSLSLAHSSSSDSSAAVTAVAMDSINSSQSETKTQQSLSSSSAFSDSEAKQKTEVLNKTYKKAIEYIDIVKSQLDNINVFNCSEDKKTKHIKFLEKVTKQLNLYQDQLKGYVKEGDDSTQFRVNDALSTITQLLGMILLKVGYILNEGEMYCAMQPPGKDPIAVRKALIAMSIIVSSLSKNQELPLRLLTLFCGLLCVTMDAWPADFKEKSSKEIEKIKNKINDIVREREVKEKLLSNEK